MSLLAQTFSRPLRIATVLAWQNLVHDWLRFAVTLVGVVFAVVLMNMEFGLFLGFARTTSGLIDHAGADLWIMARGTEDVDQVSAISERKRFQALATPGVAKAARLNVEFADYRKPDGGTESVLVVGFDPEQSMGAPWNIAIGRISDLRYPDTILVDELYAGKLGIDHVGQVVEISGHRAQVVGFTRDIRSFTQSPYVFASTSTALSYSRIRGDQTKYVLVGLAPNANPETVKLELLRRMPDMVVRTSSDFSQLTQIYWMFTTGAGLALLLGAAMGLMVGLVVVSQTLYATTVDHLAEFATLRAVGGSNGFIYGVIVRQSVLIGVIGYVVGLGIALLMSSAAERVGLAVPITSWMSVAMLAITLAMCTAAAIASIGKVTRLDPSMVFK